MFKNKKKPTDKILIILLSFDQRTSRCVVFYLFNLIGNVFMPKTSHIFLSECEINLALGFVT